MTKGLLLPTLTFLFFKLSDVDNIWVFFSFYQNLSTRILVTPCKMQHTRTNVDMQNIYAKMQHKYESTPNENKNFDLIVNFTIYYKHSNIKKITCPINLF